MKRRIAAAVLYAVVSALGPGDATAAMNAIDDDDDDDSTPPSFSTPEARDASGGGAQHGGRVGQNVPAGEGVADPLLKRVSRALGTPVDAAWVVRNRAGSTVAVAVQADPHTSVALVNAAVIPSVHGTGDSPAALRMPLSRALAHCRDRGYLKVIVTADGAAIAPLRSWVESRGYQFSRARWLDGAPAAEFYTDLYWSGGEPSSRRETHHVA
jgi:hypothetical protein